MSEITLSQNINRIETEIQFYKEQAGQSIWEIGKRLNHVKKHDLAHGEFGAWLKKIGINHPEANRIMKVAKELPNSSTLTNLGSTALYLIATLPEEAREEKHVTADGDTKTPDEMTVRELQDLKNKINQKNELIKEQQRVIDHYATKKPEVVEKIVKKEIQHPHVDDLRSDNKQLSEALKTAQAEADAAKERTNFIENQLTELLDQRKEVDEKSRRYEELTEGIRKLEGKMDDNQRMLASQKNVLDTIRAGNELLDRLSGLIYANDLEVLEGNELVISELNKLIGRVEWWLNDINKKMEKTTIIEGEILYD